MAPNRSIAKSHEGQTFISPNIRAVIDKSPLKLLAMIDRLQVAEDNQAYGTTDGLHCFWISLLEQVKMLAPSIAIIRR